MQTSSSQQPPEPVSTSASTDRSRYIGAATKPKLSIPVSQRILVGALVLGLLGGAGGALAVVRLAPGVVPVSKQAVVVQESSAVVDAAKKVTPSVVSITSQTTTRGFFGRAQVSQGSGTGVIIDSNGLILTNKHVVPNDASAFSVIDNEGKEYKDAKVLARDPRNDLALVKIEASGLKAAELGDSSSVQVGQRVVAIGNALGQFQNSVTEGIISGLGRPVTAADSDGSGAENLQNLFQTDAAINSGNSGGPLVDLAGKVIGINTAVSSEGQNIGFAIPINDARTAIDSYREKGEIIRPYLGVRYVEITRQVARANNLSVNEGAWVQTGDDEAAAVVAGSPAEKAGVRSGDIIVRFGGSKVSEKNGLSTLIGRKKVGEEVEVVVLRDGKEQTLRVKLEQAPTQ